MKEKDKRYGVEKKRRKENNINIYIFSILKYAFLYFEI
jgi:hypothetical protein